MLWVVIIATGCSASRIDEDAQCVLEGFGASDKSDFTVVVIPLEGCDGCRDSLLKFVEKDSSRREDLAFLFYGAADKKNRVLYSKVLSSHSHYVRFDSSGCMIGSNFLYPELIEIKDYKQFRRLPIHGGTLGHVLEILESHNLGTESEP